MSSYLIQMYSDFESGDQIVRPTPGVRDSRAPSILPMIANGWLKSSSVYMVTSLSCGTNAPSACSLAQCILSVSVITMNRPLGDIFSYVSQRFPFISSKNVMSLTLCVETSEIEAIWEESRSASESARTLAPGSPMSVGLNTKITIPIRTPQHCWIPVIALTPSVQKGVRRRNPKPSLKNIIRVH